MKIIANPDKNIVEEIRSALAENKKVYGKQHCPCILPSNYNDDTVCMCKDFRDKIDRGELGECHCGLYVVTND